ncbi:1-acyl-sn-glycerol-3-phosphate acyltransferase [Polyangium aurulentum]|uniref:1-acyl-sn-glycerol-3-phosphate acyltransferase n=1 Tax=Polyangium aurulentum TaxID=2567896 RepID=UPI00146A9B11|nr:1-acyl-sn-glycerol-3-phosphate acyltransferase [Polyangium aurulentum]UQA62720.1 1-acyl-sn-glycerol-3-phosphate acyltransferase [Polyangium aurulentum]
MTMSYAMSSGNVEDAPRTRDHHIPEFRADVVRRSHGILSKVMRSYFRSEVRGAERLPSSQTIIVTHHDGGILPLNGVAFGVAWYDHFGFDRPLYVLTHDLLHSVCRPFSQLLADSGLMRADRKAMDAVLSTGQSVLIFPGAARESFRTFWDRKNIDLGGRKGFVAQAIRWGLPITPVVSAGSHETLVVLSGGHNLAKKIGLPKLVRSADVLPVLAGFPWGVWALPFLPQIPLPAKMTTEVMEPVNLSEALGRNLRPSDADNPEIVQAGFDLIVDRMRKQLSALYDERRYPILG